MIRDSLDIVLLAAKSTSVILLALFLSRCFASHVRFRSTVWLVAFGSLFVMLLPLPGIIVPLLATPWIESANPPVYELDIHFVAASTKSARPLQMSVPGLLAASISGFALVVVLLRAIKTWRLVRTASQCEDEGVIAATYELCERHGVKEPPLVLVSDNLVSPCITGVLNPVLMLPASDLLVGDDQYLISVLTHEISHLSRKDHWKVGFFAFVSSLFAWNPLTWIALRNARLAMELEADERTVQSLGGIEHYAKMLVSRQADIRQMSPARFHGSNTALARVRQLSAGSKSSLLPNWMLIAFIPILLPKEIGPRFDDSFDLAVISPNEVVYSNSATAPFTLYRMMMDGSGKYVYRHAFHNATFPTVSPDGRRIAFVKGEGSGRDIYIADADGGNETVLVDWPDRDDQPIFSPDGKKVLFMSMSGGKWRIFVHDMKTAESTFIQDGYEARWHPSGERILFSSGRGGGQALWSVDVDGSDLVKLTDGSSSETGGFYAADGRSVLFAALYPWNYNIFQLDLQTHRVRQLTVDEANEAEAFLSPFGDYVFYTTFVTGTPQIGRMRIDGSDKRILTTEGGSWPMGRVVKAAVTAAEAANAASDPSQPGLADTPWPRGGGDERNTNQGQGVGAVGKLWWTFTASSEIRTSISIGVDGNRYFGDKDGFLYAVDKNGELRWSFQTGGAVESTPAVANDGTVLFGSNDGFLYALSPNGKLKYSFKAEDAVRTSPVVAENGTIYFGGFDRYLYALSPEGRMKWRFLSAGPIYSSPALGRDGSIYFATLNGGTVYAVRPNGVLKWKRKLDKGDWIFPSVVVRHDGSVVVAGGSPGGRSVVVSFSPLGGVNWTYRLPAWTSASPAVTDDGTVFIASEDSKLHCLGQVGARRWVYAMGAWSDSTPTIGPDGVVYVGCSDGRLYAVNPNGRQRWSYKTAGVIRHWSPTLDADGTLYIGSGTRLYAIR